MIFTEKEIKRRLRHLIKRQLKAGRGHCQISVRRLGKSVFPRKGNGHFVEGKPDMQLQQNVYRIAVELCEHYGGHIWTWTHHKRKSYNNAARVYQF